MTNAKDEKVALRSSSNCKNLKYFASTPPNTEVIKDLVVAKVATNKIDCKEKNDVFAERNRVCSIDVVCQ